MLTLMYWTVIGLATLLVFWLGLVRITKQFINFPIPAWMVSLIDNPLRRKIQPPPVLVGWMEIEKGMSVLEIGPGAGTFTAEACRRTGPEGEFHVVDNNPKMQQKMKATLERGNLRRKK